MLAKRAGIASLPHGILSGGYPLQLTALRYGHMGTDVSSDLNLSGFKYLQLLPSI